MAYATITAPMSPEEARKFDEDIGMRTSPESMARDALRKWQEAQGMTFEDPDAPVAAPLGSRDEEVPGTWMGQ